VLGEPDIDGLAAAAGEALRVLLWNYHDDIRPGPAAPLRLEITAPAGRGERARITHYRIDHTRSNAYTEWLSLGGPKAPTAEQLEEMARAGELATLGSPVYRDIRNGRIELEFELPRHGVSLIEIFWR
jgi:xylan 1,4-beta-xylosidase